MTRVRKGKGAQDHYLVSLVEWFFLRARVLLAGSMAWGQRRTRIVAHLWKEWPTYCIRQNAAGSRPENILRGEVPHSLTFQPRSTISTESAAWRRCFMRDNVF